MRKSDIIQRRNGTSILAQWIKTRITSDGAQTSCASKCDVLRRTRHHLGGAPEIIAYPESHSQEMVKNIPNKPQYGMGVTLDFKMVSAVKGKQGLGSLSSLKKTTDTLLKVQSALD